MDVDRTVHPNSTRHAEDEESEFGSCLGGFERYLDYTDVHFEGETARAFSDDFELAGEDETDSARLCRRRGAHRRGISGRVLDDFVTALGAEETVPCMTDQLAGEDFAEDEPTLEIDVTNESDLGIGEASARLDMTLAVDYEGTAFESVATFAAARVDRSLVIVVAGATGGGAGDLDPIAELEAMVDSFG